MVNGLNSKNLNSGHRRRMMEKYLLTGFQGMGEHEILEMMLYPALLRQDTKVLAKQLLLKFGSIAMVLDAENSELIKIDGVGERTIFYLKLFRAIIPLYLEQSVLRRECLNSGVAAAEFVKAKLGGNRYESSMILYLNNQNRLLTYEVSAGTVDRAAVYPRNIAKRALELGATGVIIAHNHPAGDCYPSNEDISLTKMVAEALGVLDIRVLDHVIVSAEGFINLAEMGLM